MRIAVFLVTLILLIGTAACIEPISTGPDPVQPNDPELPFGSFAASYYGGESFDELIAEREDEAIDFDWGLGAPLDGMPSDFFSVRWEGRFAFEDAQYTFTATTDDGMRVWIDDELILDEWREQVDTFVVTVPVSAGERIVRVEYFERQYGAIAQLDWSLADDAGDIDPDPVDPTDPIPDPSETITLTFPVDTTTDFMNPERGWMIREPHTSANFRNARNGDPDNPVGYTVVWSYMTGTPWTGSSGNPFRLDNYKERDIPSSLHTELDEIFASARESGVKMKVRFAYNYDDVEPSDTSLYWMTRHIEQLAQTLNKNKDTIASVDVGFVGKWGEFHGTTELVDSTNNWWQEPWLSAYVEIYRTELEHFDEDIMIMMRQPRDDRGYRLYFNGASADRPFWRDFDPEDRFTGTDQSRVGWVNDCLWTDEDHAGTFNFDGNEGVIDREAASLSGRYAATSGETCKVGGLNSWNDGAFVVSDMEYLGGPDHLYRKFYDQVYDKWIASGHYDEISRRLGYRIALTEATIPTTLSPGSMQSIELSIVNDGFGKVYNPRPLELVLMNAQGTYRIRLSDDARRDLPLAGEEVTSEFVFSVPNIPAGTYEVGLVLPDPSPRLEDDARYAIKLANEGFWSPDLWDEGLGVNELGVTIEIV